MKTRSEECGTKQPEKKNKTITIKANKKGRHKIALMNVLRVIFIPLYYIIKPFRYYGNRKVKDGACVYVVNHYTLLDPIYVAGTTWEGIHFVAKKQIEKMFLIGWFAKKVKCIMVNRDGHDVRGVLDCLKCLKNNEKIAIFPEGTRNKTSEEPLPFKHGAAALAIKSKTPVVPMVIYEKPRLFHCTHILVGDPIVLSEYYDRKLSEEETLSVDDMLRKTLISMKAEHKAFLESKKKGKKA